MPDREKIQSVVDSAHAQYGKTPGGANADYIPFLANIPSDLAAVAVVTAQGQCASAGDAQYRFAIESISKVCTLALALEDMGRQAVQEKIGVSPTGLPFNSVMALELHGDKPLSPLVNAGAMAAASLVKAAGREERWQRILDMQRRLGAKDIVMSDELNNSEQTTNFHNRGIAWLLFAAGYMYCDPMEACDVYTRQCSTLLTTVELATIGATIAARGRNPLTGEQVLKPENCACIMAEMTMEGLYDSSGAWAYTVGLPGKSGVGGGILTIVPGIMGIAAFSPPLDPVGNSVRGQKMAAFVARELGYNLYAS
ncbi:glutaminase A [Desulfovibrio sp. 86]|uniref:Glutaminase n=1 Tax=uncultured Desulfovibrio sp. TaxID=167968 RepID=A0A212L5V2_9BACT|nr:glutaminase A [Desulfovibrio sp. 86]SCM72719.1 amidase, possibly glutaminase [uncultured Desulfovibrio sp.]VZH33698.1 amidase, possibly glutaminase [Desulfovibrio sp. 86]